MRRTGWGLLALVLMVSGGAWAKSGTDTQAWLFQQLGGQWQAMSGVAEASLKHQGAGVFRVHSTGQAGLLGRWNGRQVRLGGPVRTDDRGWTYFTLEGEACRIGKRSDGKKVLEIGFGDPAQRLELTER